MCWLFMGNLKSTEGLDVYLLILRPLLTAPPRPRLKPPGEVMKSLRGPQPRLRESTRSLRGLRFIILPFPAWERLAPVRPDGWLLNASPSLVNSSRAVVTSMTPLFQNFTGLSARAAGHRVPREAGPASCMHSMCPAPRAQPAQSEWLSV